MTFIMAPSYFIWWSKQMNDEDVCVGLSLHTYL